MVGETIDLIIIWFNQGTQDTMNVQLRCLVTKAIMCDLLLGHKALFPLGFMIDN